mgnify:CR=1 FL=1
MKKTQSFAGETVKTVSGLCPVDQSAIGTLSLADRELDIALLSRWFYYGIHVCPLCLAGSSESDFSFGPGQHDSIRQLTLSPYSRMKTDFTELLPARLTLAKRFLHDLSPGARAGFMAARMPHLESSIVGLIRLVLPNIGSQALDILAKQCVSLLSQNKDIGLLTGKITTVLNVREHLPENHPVSCLLKIGGNLNEIVQAAVYGALISGIDQSCLSAMTSPDPATSDPWLRMAQLHLELDRFSIYTHYIARHGALEKIIAQQPAGRDEPKTIVDLVEDHVKEAFAEGNVLRMQAGYDLFLLGRNYYKAFNLASRRLKHTFPSPDDYARTITPLAAKAIYFLELSLVAEKYPELELEQDEALLHLNKKNNITVPFLFGEFGVRHMLCLLYDAMSDIGTAGHPIEHSLEELGNSIRTHWGKNHVKFKALDFGRFNDPMPAQVLIPRTIAFASVCSQPGTRQYMLNIIQRSSGDLYTRYVTGAESLVAAYRAGKDLS